jgi:site-specific recombinase XerD
MEGRSPFAVSTDRKAMRSLFSFLREEGLWPVDPTEKLKGIKVPFRSREAPSMEEVEKMLTYRCRKPDEDARYHMMTLLLMTTGLRISEAAGLRKSGINLAKRELKVVGKGDKEGMVPLLPVTVDAIREYMRAHPDGGSPFLFPGKGKTGYWSIYSYEKTLKRACAAVGIKKYTPHCLRHFFATYTLEHGAKLEVVSKILRHAKVGTTADIYRHVRTGEMHEEQAKFSPLSQQPPAPRLAGPSTALALVPGEGVRDGKAA